MAITYIVGNPGSGKTYFAVYKIYEYFVEPNLPSKKIFGITLKRNIKKFDYLYCYTNINGFDFSIDDRILKFDYDVFYLYLAELYNLYSSGVSDEILNIKANELKLFKSMFIIDEVHNIFKNKDDKILIWWLTYHRHLHQELIFITQDLSLISNEYKRIAEFFYKALDSGKRIFKTNLRYVQFSSYKMYQKDLVPGGRFSLKIMPEVFKLYHSGDNTIRKSFFTRILFSILILLFLLFFAFYFFMSFFKVDEIKDNADTNSTIEINSSKVLNVNDDRNLSFDLNSIKNYSIDNNSPEMIDLNSIVYIVSCLGSKCKITDKDDNLYIDIPKVYFIKFLKSNELIFEHLERNNAYLSYFLVFKTSVFENLKKGVEKGVKNEKNSFFNSPNDFGSR